METSAANKPYVMCEKWAGVSESAEVIRSFFEFLQQKGLSLGQFYPTTRLSTTSDGGPDIDPETGQQIEIPTGKIEYQPTHTSLESLIYQHFEIDPVQLENERRALLGSCQDGNR